jgi:osmotically inducible protein OsmC
MQRKAQARWNGDLKSGNGSISTASGTLSNAPYSFHTRFEDGKGTNPEELLAAAHAGCFSMALSNQLAQAGLKAESIETECTITLDKKDGGFGITESHLELRLVCRARRRRRSTRRRRRRRADVRCRSYSTRTLR